MTEQTKVTVWGPKEVSHWLQTRVMQQVVPLLPNREKDWPSFEVALRAAVIRDTEFGEGKLQDAIGYNPNAALLAVVKCARLGLSLNPADEHFCLVPYSRVVEGQAMYRGWLHLLNQSGQCEGLGADVVYKQEQLPPGIPFVDQLSGAINHSPHAFERDSYPDSDMVGVYAWCKVKGRPRIVSAVLGRAKVEKLRALNKGKAPAWNAHPQRMWCAKALKALCRSGLVPLKPQQMAELLKADEDGAPTPTIQSPPLARPSGVVVDIGQPRTDSDWDAGQQATFDEHNKDPLPSAEDELAIQRKAILALQKEKKVTAAGLALLCKKVVGEDATLEQLSLESLAQVAEMLRAD